MHVARTPDGQNWYFAEIVTGMEYITLISALRVFIDDCMSHLKIFTAEKRLFREDFSEFSPFAVNPP
jgi:hypothetical protein